MGSCIICGTSVDGRVCQSHEQDVAFEFRGDHPNQLTPGRYYRGTVDGYADFGVFVDLASGVTGLLHRSELDRRLESLEWEPGDAVFVQVKNVRDNGNVDLGWSIRQAEREFRAALVQDGEGDHDVESDGGDAADGRSSESPAGSSTSSGSAEPAESSGSSGSGGSTASAGSSPSGGQAAIPAEKVETSEVEADAESVETDEYGREGEYDEPEPAGERERVEVGSLPDRVGEQVRIEGEVVGARQTGGPTVFELRDETGVVDCAAFVEAGVRAYPEVDVGDVVRLDGEVEVRREELQVETEALAVLDGEEREAVERRLADALTSKARPEAVKPLAEHESVAAVGEQLLDAAEAVRRAVLESRPVVVRHAATADGYVAGAAIERAVLPLVRDEHAQSDAEYHYFVRRPLDEAVYGMDAATNDVTQMLQGRDRHDEKLPLVVLVGTGSTAESRDGLDLLSIYGARRVVVDAATADDDVVEAADVVVNPGLAGADAHDLSTGALGANLAAAVNDDVREDLAHLPAVSYWENAPQAYLDLAADAGYDADRTRELREAIELEAYYQSYQDKRELIADLLWADDEAADVDPDAGTNLAGHVAEQFREKLSTEVETAEANLETREVEGVTFASLDADAFTHRFDFPPTTLLLDELHRRNREGDYVTLGVAMDELFIRSTGDLDVRAVAAAAREQVPQAGITANGVRENRIEFLSGARERVQEAVIEAVAAQFE